MKFGETLQERSLADPGWSHHNVDYNDIKSFIKEYTAPGKGKAMSIPGHTDLQLLQSENSLFHILKDQHDRIDLVVRSKAGEIQRRLDHSNKQLRQLAAHQGSAEHRISVRRLEKYGKLDNDVIKAGDDIRSLARFTSTQRTAFRKLLKKHKKWTGSAQLEDRFRDEVLDQPKSFTKLDLGSLLDEYSTTRHGIRTLYDQSVQWGAKPSSTDGSPSSSTIRKLQTAIESASKVAFDTAIATVPLGQEGTFASFFVHPENVVELQVFLLHHAQYFDVRSRSNSIASPVSTSRNNSSAGIQHPDFHMIAADSIERFASEQGSLTVNDREHLRGSFPQRARACVRWNTTEDAMACLRSKSGKAKAAALKRKHARAFFDRDALFSASQSAASAESDEDVDDVRQEFIRTADVQLLFHYSSCRTRMTGINDSSDNMTMATLDTGIRIASATAEENEEAKEEFPFALLLVRQEGVAEGSLLTALEDSHLVERVRGFSLEYHAVWSVYQPPNMRAPFWLSVLTRDIRKLPPPAIRHSSSGSATRSAESRGSLAAPTDSTTAVETAHNSMVLETPPLKSFRNKKRRVHTEPLVIQETQQRYWNEYDDPEDGSEDPNAFVLYVNPNEESIFDRFFDRLANLFGQKQEPHHRDLQSPASPHSEDGTSSDEGSALLSPRTTIHPRHHREHAFGTFASSPAQYAQRKARSAFIPNFTATCYIASIVILFMAYVLAMTGRHKYVTTVDAGVFTAIISSLIFAVIGFLSVLRLGSGALSLPAWALCILLLVTDAVGSGSLVAWMVWA